MNVLDRKKKAAEIMRMKSNIMDAEVQIEERKQEIDRIGDKIETFNNRILVLEEELETKE